MISTSGRRVTGLVALVLGISVVGGLDRRTLAQAPIEGRVLDEAGRPIDGAIVRLYRSEARWATRDGLVETALSGPDGSFRLATRPLPPGPPVRWGRPELVLIADHLGYAVGWRAIPRGHSWQGEVRLTPDRVPRTITVVDEAGNPLAGASVFVTSLGDPDSPIPCLRDYLALQPVDGPLTAITDGAGRARFPDLPRTPATFAASKPGWAENVCYKGEVIHLSPAATLEGTLTGTDGQPLPGMTIRIMAGFIHGFRVGQTDTRGRYRFDALPARGWDKSEIWQPGTVGDGSYKLWLEGEEFAIPTQLVTLEPNEQRTMNLQAQPAGVIRVTVVEAETGRRVPGVVISGSDAATGNGVRFHAVSDEQGVARIFAAPASMVLSLIDVPKDLFIDRRALEKPGTGWQGDFVGGELDLTFTSPRIGGRVATIEGRCVGPVGVRVGGIKVHAASEPFDAAVDFGFVRASRVDEGGGFVLDRVPLVRSLGLFAINEDGMLAAFRLIKPDREAATEPIRLDLRPTVPAEFTLQDDRGNPVPLHQVEITIGPKFGYVGTLARRVVLSDGQGRVRIDRVVPGLTYHVADASKSRSQPGGGTAKMESSTIEADLILVPE